MRRAAGHCNSGTDAPLRCAAACRICRWPAVAQDAYGCDRFGRLSRMLSMDGCEAKRRRCARPPDTPALVGPGGVSATMERLLRDFPQYEPRAVSRPSPGDSKPWVVTLQNFLSAAEVDAFIDGCSRHFARSLAGDELSPVRARRRDLERPSPIRSERSELCCAAAAILPRRPCRPTPRHAPRCAFVERALRWLVASPSRPAPQGQARSAGAKATRAQRRRGRKRSRTESLTCCACITSATLSRSRSCATSRGSFTRWRCRLPLLGTSGEPCCLPADSKRRRSCGSRRSPARMFPRAATRCTTTRTVAGSRRRARASTPSSCTCRHPRLAVALASPT